MSVALFDVPCTYDDMYFETLAIADQVVLVGEQKIPSIRTLKLVCEALTRIDGASLCLDRNCAARGAV